MKRGYKRLLKLADHLESDRRGHDVFDFSIFHQVNRCGSIGCALGECPTLWKSWIFDGRYPKLKFKRFLDIEENVKYWFGISGDAVDHLFYPESQHPDRFGGKELGDDATAHEVAENMRAFVNRKAATNKPKGEG